MDPCWSLTVWQRVTLNSWASCCPLHSAGVTGTQLALDETMLYSLVFSLLWQNIWHRYSGEVCSGSAHQVQPPWQDDRGSRPVFLPRWWEATAACSYLRGSRSRKVVLTQLSLPSPLVFWFKVSVFPRITLNSEQFCLCLLSAEMCEAPCLAPFSPLIQSQLSRPWDDAIHSQGEVPPALSLLWKHRHRHTQSVPPWFPRPCLPSPVKLMIKGRI